jgi:hypothetical protein
MTIHAQGSTVGSIFLTALTIYLAAKGAMRIMRHVRYRPKWLAQPLRRWNKAREGIVSVWYALRMAKALRVIEKTLIWAEAGEVHDRQELCSRVFEAVTHVETRSQPSDQPTCR